MKKTAAQTFLLALAFGFAGCGTMSTIASRSQEKSASFSAASLRDQRIMQRGLVAAGFTPDMVYIALDKPDTATKMPDGHTERWIYRNFPLDSGSFVMGKQKVVSGGPFGGGSGGVSPTRPAVVAGPGGVAANAGASNVSGGSVATRADPSQAIDAWQRHLVLTFTDGKLTAMELFEM